MDDLFGAEQLALFKLPDETVTTPWPTEADACALHLASEFRRQYADQGSPEQVTEDLETLCLACLLLVSDYGVRSHPRLLHEFIMCRECLKTPQPWRIIDSLPFDICLQLLGYPSNGLETLEHNLVNSSSGIREWMFEIGWFVRRHITPKMTGNMGSTYKLLKNVEDTLGFWDFSLALCRSLYPTREEFWSAVEFYKAEAMPDQFAERIEWVRQNMVRVEWHAGFMVREVQVRRAIDELTLRRLGGGRGAVELL